MSKLAGIVFSREAKVEFEVNGIKIVVRKLTARDMLSLETDISSFAEDKIDMKIMLASTIDILSSIIVSINGITEEKQAIKEFLLDQEQTIVTEIFQKAEVYGKNLEEELKNSEGTEPSAQNSK